MQPNTPGAGNPPRRRNLSAGVLACAALTAGALAARGIASPSIAEPVDSPPGSAPAAAPYFAGPREEAPPPPAAAPGVTTAAAGVQAEGDRAPVAAQAAAPLATPISIEAADRAPQAAAAPTGNTALRPNILIIMADDLGWGDLGAYGQRTILTPNLDRMAREGRRFTQFYAGAPLCAPSRACLLTGKHAGHAAIRGNQSSFSPRAISLPAGEPSLGTLAKNAGYATAVIGKWGLAGNWNRAQSSTDPGMPSRHGFGLFYGYKTQEEAHNHYPPALWRNETSTALPSNAGGKRGYYAQNAFTTESLNFIRQNKSRPFLLCLNYTAPHINLTPPNVARYDGRGWTGAKRNYAAMVSLLDSDVGVVLNALRNNGVDNQTLVLFTSDNGPHREGGYLPEMLDSNGPLRGGKRDMTEGGIRVPLLARWPGKIPAGGVSDYVWSMPDILPTVAELTGQTVPASVDGKSVLPALTGRIAPGASQPYYYWESNEPAFKQAIRKGDWKGIRSAPGQALQLYNLRQDVGEAKNVAGANPAVVAELNRLLQGARTPHALFPMNSKPLY